MYLYSTFKPAKSMLVATRTVSRRRTLPTPVAFTMRIDATLRDKALHIAEELDQSLAKMVRDHLKQIVADYEAKNGEIKLEPPI